MDKKQALNRLSAIEEETKQLRKIIDKEDDWTSIVDFKSACKWLGKDSSDLLDKWKYANLSLYQINNIMLETCIQAVNTANGKRWTPDFKNRDQKKWYNWFEVDSSGLLVFSSVHYSYYAFYGFVGYYYETEEKAKHGAKYFKQYINHSIE